MKQYLVFCSCVVLTLFLLVPCPAQAFFFDTNNTVQLRGKLSTQFAIRVQDSEMWTRPDTEVGDLVQHRNMLLLELDHDLRNLIDEVHMFKPFKWAGLDVKYHLVGRFVYDGVYDYGPSAFQDVKDEEKGLIENFQLSSDLWEAYLDLSRGPVFFRLGRQNLSWGETDAFKILDWINPVDNTFGAFFESLEDRRIPLWMLRGSVELGTHGPFTSISLEGFWVPGFLDNTMAPMWRPYLFMAPDATPYAVPQPEVPFPSTKDVPNKSMASSRWGARITGILFDNLGFSLAHFHTFTDEPMLRMIAPEGDFGSLALEMSHHQIKLTGASINYYEPHIDLIVRSEVAMSWNEPIFTIEDNMALSDSYTPEIGGGPFGFGIDFEGIFSGLGLPWPGWPDGMLSGDLTGGTIPKRDILRWMIGLDKFFWIRPLNRNSTFLFSTQWFCQYILDWDESIAYPIAIGPKDLPDDPLEELALSFNFSNRKEMESNFTLIMSTMYWHGKIVPEMATIYDARGSWYVQPSVTLALGPWRFTAMYNAAFGKMANLGVGLFRDRDQVALRVTYQID